MLDFAEYLKNIDLVIAMGIFIIALIVFFLVHIHALPVKTAPYVIGSLIALLGIEIFKAYRGRKLDEQIKAKKRTINDRQQHLDDMKKDLTISEQQYHEATNKLLEFEAAHVKTTEILKAEDEKRRQEIEKMSTEELFRSFGRVAAPAPGGAP
jgi:hypothetical protein